MQYEEQILIKGAYQLWSEAATIVATTALVFGFSAFALGSVIGIAMAVLSKQPGMGPTVLAFGVVGVIIGVAIGIWEGNRRAFELKVRAQQILALVQIEHNTR